MSANTISSRTYRDKYRQASLQRLLRKVLVAQAVLDVDNSNADRIQNPYGSQASVTAQALTGTYSIAAWTTTDDTLTVTDEFPVGEQVYDYEQLLTAFDMFANRINEQNYAVAQKIDQWAINCLTNDAGATYTTPAGGFTTPANITAIVANLAAVVMGYQGSQRGLYLIVENTDTVGFAQAQVAQGFSYSDMALRNGFMNSYMGVDIYVVRSGTFVSATIGTRTFTNSGHRVFGVKGSATLLLPSNIKVMEKEVSGKTGYEIATVAYAGFKQWFSTANLTVNITLA